MELGSSASSWIGATTCAPLRSYTATWVLTATTKKLSPMAPVVSDGKEAGSASASNPDKNDGTRVRGIDGARCAVTGGRERRPNSSNEVGLRSETPAPVPRAVDQLPGRAWSLDRPVAGVAISATLRARTTRTGNSHRDVRMRALPPCLVAR